MKKRQLTPEQRQATEARRAAFRELARRVSKMPDDEKAAFVRRHPEIITIEGRGLSLVNTILICMQLPAATIVGGFQQWKKHGRSVKKGEHGAAIWIPGGAKGGEGGGDAGPTAGEIESAVPGESVRFLTATVFDVTQTQEIAAGDDPSKVIDIGDKPAVLDDACRFPTVGKPPAAEEMERRNDPAIDQLLLM